MKKNGGSLKAHLRRWFDECKLAFSGVMLATRERRFIITFLVTFVVFGVLINLLASSTAALSLFWAGDFSDRLAILGDAFIGIFGIHRNFWDWLPLFMMDILQSVLIALVVLVWKKRRRSKADQVAATASNADNVQHAGIAASLAVLGSGCPTCGTTLLMPLLGTLFSTSSLMLASILSGILTLAAALLALWTIKRLGNEAYVMIVSERFTRLHRKTSSQTAAPSTTSTPKTVNQSEQSNQSNQPKSSHAAAVKTESKS